MENSTDYDQIDTLDKARKKVAILIRSILRIMHGK